MRISENAAQNGLTISAGFERPSPDARIQLYREMLRIRRLEEEIIRRYPEQEMRCPTHICIGQEAPPVGVSWHLNMEDAVFSAHRSHGHYLAKGGDMRGMIAELYGKVTGCAMGKGGSQHLIDQNAGFMGSAPILASTISVGVGAAWAMKRRGEPRLVVIYFGDGATEEGAFHEAMNFAGTNQLPVLFVCENNLYSVHTPLDSRQPARSICSLASVHGMKGLEGDGQNLEEVWQLADQAVSHIRSGLGPVLLELSTYRFKEHCGPNDDDRLGYRSKEEIDLWTQEKCPIALYEQKLFEEHALTENDKTELIDGIEREVADAFDFAIRSEFPGPDALDKFVYPNQKTAP